VTLFRQNGRPRGRRSRRRRKHQLRKRKASGVTTRLVPRIVVDEARTIALCGWLRLVAASIKPCRLWVRYHRNSQHCPSALFTARFVTCLSRCLRRATFPVTVPSLLFPFPGGAQHSVSGVVKGDRERERERERDFFQTGGETLRHAGNIEFPRAADRACAHVHASSNAE